MTEKETWLYIEPVRWIARADSPWHDMEPA
jgi:hypothetical protein